MMRLSYNPAECTILVVDDEEMNRDMLCRRLERKGFPTQSAADGFQALQDLDLTGVVLGGRYRVATGCRDTTFRLLIVLHDSLLSPPGGPIGSSIEPTAGPGGQKASTDQAASADPSCMRNFKKDVPKLSVKVSFEQATMA